MTDPVLARQLQAVAFCVVGMALYLRLRICFGAMPNLRLLRASADGLPFADHQSDLVISINTIHNLGLERCKQAIRVDSWLTDDQHQHVEPLTAVTSFEPDGWRRLFHEVGHTSDSSWTMTE